MAELYFDSEQCILCGQCVEKCPFGALEIKNDRVEINASCKMCRLCVKTCPVNAVSLVETEEKKAVVDKDAWSGVMVFVEQEEAGIHPVAFELLGKAQELAGKIHQPVYAVIIGGENVREQAELLPGYGADRVFVYAHSELAYYRGDVYVNVMESCINRVKPAVVLVGATALGRSLAPACATRFRTGLTADCTMLDMKENTDLVQVRPAFGGNIMAQIITTNTRPQFATVRYKVMNAVQREDAHGEIVECEVTHQMLRSKIEVLGTQIMEHKKSIEEDVLVVAGRGVKKEEDLEMLRELADALGGQMATTRPLVEKGWGDVTTQIGLSGRTVKPKLIITCGVSGAVQFAAGMDGSECIVSVNTDPEAPIFRIANYCVVKDLYEFIPELLRAVRNYRG
ncbi:MAG: electron transfer flavoprotein subunit alpha [Lachnospiraceae bacterium]|nr:electron transfer flavoprotein subunit alpha [Lachnospiraceae bacterium]